MLRSFQRITTGLLIATVLAGVRFAAADGLTDQAAKISAQSFALLAALNAQSGGGGANPLLGPVASFSADAESLRQALASGDSAAIVSAMQTLQTDRASIDDALRSNPKAMKGDDWNAIRSELDAIAPQVARLGSAKASSAAPPGGSAMPTVSAPPPAVAAAPSAPVVASASSAPASAAAAIPYPAPVVKIESREPERGGLRVKGFIQGTALKSAGVYENGRCVKAFDVNAVPGEQKIQLDLGIGSPSPDTTIRVTDAAGRFAEATVVDAASLPPPAAENAEASSAPEGPIALGGSTNEAGVDVFRDSRGDTASAESSSATVKEIPSHGASIPAAPSPARRHALGGKLANVTIDILGVSPSATTPHGYEAIGQIDGAGVTRAGIYVDGRLVHPIAVASGADLTNFDETFTNNGGGAATVRAYGAGNQFVESSLDVTEGTASMDELGPPASAGPASAPGIGVMITSVRPLGANLYQVAGTISGRNIASAGLYQNGALAQSIGIGGKGLAGSLAGGLSGGLGSMLGALLPGTSQSFNFNVRYNAGAGFASIRAYDRAGAFTEQPVIAGGVNPYGAGNPYGSVNPYGGGGLG
ncbi:MAG TPA: hypothetical protein VNU00_07980, partial [Candidatus Binataceae bacterium]|nr:hypothetical protein [Candidatus Binataceae bacterium]